MALRTTYKRLPRSTLSVLHDPIVDPRDGHGAGSAHDIFILRKWAAAQKGDDDALIDLIKHIVREDLTKLKAARNQCEMRIVGGEPYKIRTLMVVMALLRMIKVETTEVPPERDGFVTVTSRKKITFEPWFANYAFERKGVDPQAVSHAKKWLDDGGIQRPRRGEMNC